jgi:hypothetical protein
MNDQVLTLFAYGDGWHAMDDYNQCCAAADRSQLATLESLLYDHISERLGALTGRRLAARLRGTPYWHDDEGVRVYRTTDRPCVAYAAVRQERKVVLLVLGFVLEAPPDDLTWWREIIQPRLRELI